MNFLSIPIYLYQNIFNDERFNFLLAQPINTETRYKNIVEQIFSLYFSLA